MCNLVHGQTAYQERITPPPRRARGSVGTTAAALLLLGTVAGGGAWADVTFYVRASAGARVGSDHQIDGSGDLQTPPATAGALVNPLGPDSGSATASAGFGSLTAFAAASSVDEVLALGSSEAEWSDTFVATSSDPGVTQITFLATITLSDSLTATDHVRGSAGTGILLLDDSHGPGEPAIVHLQDATFLPPLESRTATVMFTEPVGVPFRLVGFLLASAETGDLGGEGNVVVDASGGATFNLDPVTPEGGYTTASGASYLSPP